MLAEREPETWPVLPLAGSCVGVSWAGDPQHASKYYRARYYDPKVGRFISEDPIGFAGGVNFYAYVGDSPVDWTDPFGLKECRGLVRILGGNPRTVGKQGGVPGVTVAAGSSAVIPSQFGASSGAGLASYASSVSGGFPSAIGTVPAFNGITDVIGSTNIPAGYQNIRDYLQAQYPGRTIIELPTGTDMGTREMTLNVPDNAACPPGTYEGNQCSAR